MRRAGDRRSARNRPSVAEQSHKDEMSEAVRGGFRATARPARAARPRRPAAPEPAGARRAHASSDVVDAGSDPPQPTGHDSDDTPAKSTAGRGCAPPAARIAARLAGYDAAMTVVCAGNVKRAEREAIMRQGVTLPETPRERRELAGLAADLEGSPLAGRSLPLRLRNFRPSTERYLASLGGPARLHAPTAADRPPRRGSRSAR